MAIGVSEEHEELRRALRRWTDRYCPSDVPRALLDVDDDVLPPVWADLAEQGWIGIHVPEELGGQGFGILELAIVAEELGRVIAPGPFVPTALAAALLARGSGDVQKSLLPGVLDGSTPACVAFGRSPAPLPAAHIGAGGVLSVTGTLPAVLGVGLAAVAVVPVAVAGAPEAGSPDAESLVAGPVRWCAIELRGPDGQPAAGVTVVGRPCLDPTRRTAEIQLDGVTVAPERVLDGVTSADVDDVAVVVASAELVGSARWSLETATEHA